MSPVRGFDRSLSCKFCILCYTIIIMARLARVVLPGIPHHITQRGVRSMDVFFSDTDRQDYLRLLQKHGRRHGLVFLAWCLMSNHVHLIVIPEHLESLAKGIGEAHKAYTRMVNFRQDTRGYLFQGRFASCPLGERHFFAALRYVLRNPVQAGLVEHASDWPWSSARWHLGIVDSDPLVGCHQLLEQIDDWNAFLLRGDDDVELLRRHTRAGRPLGGPEFVFLAELITGRKLVKRRPGPTKLRT